jgi:hypothetical protein
MSADTDKRQRLQVGNLKLQENRLNDEQEKRKGNPGPFREVWQLAKGRDQAQSSAPFLYSQI